MKDEDILQEAREAFDLAAEAESENRLDALDDLRVSRLAEQWPDAVKKQRELEGRPCLTINRLPSFIRQVVNDARQNKPQIKVQPQDSNADPETAEVMSGLIRNIEVSSDADVAYDTAIDSAVTCGVGYFRINTAYTCDDTFDQDIVFERVGNPFSVYGDPYSTAADSSDWNTAFVVDTMTKKAFEREYKGAEAVDWDGVGYTGLPAPWMDGEEVMVAEYWTREKVSRQIVALSDGSVMGLKEYEKALPLYQAMGVEVVGSPREAQTYKVTQRILTGAEVLKTVEWAGKYIPIVPVYGDEVNVEGRRYFRSLIRDAKDPQRMLNYWRSAATELVALAPKAPFIGRKGAFETDAAKWATANSATHSHIEYDGPEAPQRQPFAGIPAGALQEALNAADDMKSIMGIFDAALGAKSNETSGRAIIARQREGDVSSFHFIDNLSRAIRHGGRILIDLIPKVYNTERMIRVLGPEMQPQTVKVGSAPEGPTEGMERVYDLTAGKYDLTVTAGPSFTTRREEAASQMVELIRAFPPAAPVLGDLLAKNLDWPGADEIAERLQSLMPPQVTGEGQQQGPDPMAMAQAEQQAQQAQADTQIKAQEAVAKAQLEQQKLQIEAFRAETERMKVQHEIQQPSEAPRNWNDAA